MIEFLRMKQREKKIAEELKIKKNKEELKAIAEDPGTSRGGTDRSAATNKGLLDKDSTAKKDKAGLALQ
jgi:hypothetical protein